MKFKINNYIEKIVCPSCNSKSYKIIKPAYYHNIKNYEDLLNIYKSSSDAQIIDQLSQCLNCELLYLNPRVKSDIIFKSYNENLDMEHISQDNQRYKTFKNSFDKIVSRLKLRNFKSKKFLDIGSASGVFLKVLKDIGFKEEGYEPSVWMVKYGREKYNVNLRHGSIDKVDKNKKFDFISLWDVLEHVTDLKFVLDQINAISKKNTILIINIPAIDTLACKILKYKWPFFLNVHLYYFTSKTLCSLLEKRNFKLVSKFPHWQFLEIGYVLKRASSYFSIFKYIIKFTEFLNLSKKSIPYNAGQTTFIFKKNG